MKFNEQTLEVLKNFSTINPSIVFKPGNSIATIAPMKTVFARATTEIEFPIEFGVYDLSRFIQLLSKFKNPEIECEEKNLLISEAGSNESSRFVYCSAQLVATPPDNVRLPTTELEFDLKDETLSRAMDLAATLSSPHLAFVGNGSEIILRAFNSENDSDNDWQATIGKTVHNFTLVYSLENIKLLPRDYKVAVSSKGLSKFTADDIEYFVAIDAKTSKFGS